MQPKSSAKLYFPRLPISFRYYLLIIFIAIAVFIALIYFFSYFKLRHILIEGEITNHKIFGLENLKGVNLIFLTQESVTNIIYKNNPAIEIEEITKVYPDKLFLKLNFSIPLAQLKLNSGFAQLSENGRVFKKIKALDKKLPVINFYQQFDYFQISVGDVFNYEELNTVLFLLKKCRDLDLLVESIDISGLSMIVFNLKEKKILFTTEKKAEKQAEELETLLRQFKIKAQDFQSVDLRFAKPIVRF